MDTIHELDLTTLEWRQLATTIPDGPTSLHVAVALHEQDMILIHNHRCIDHVLLFDPQTHSISNQATRGGRCPGSRGLHAATLVIPHSVAVFGGAAKDGIMSNEAFVPDTRTWEWSPLAAANDLSSEPRPSPWAGPCLVTYEEHRVILFGGAEATASGLVPRADVWMLSILDGGHLKWLIDDNNVSSQEEDDDEEEGLQYPPARNCASLTAIQQLATNNDNVPHQTTSYLLRETTPHQHLDRFYGKIDVHY